VDNWGQEWGGQPVHVFWYEQLPDEKFVVRAPKPGNDIVAITPAVELMPPPGTREVSQEELEQIRSGEPIS
jgi:hypothetical protein